MQTFGIVSTSSWAALMSSSFLGPSTAPIEDRLGFLERARKLPKSCIQRCVIEFTYCLFVIDRVVTCTVR